MDRNAQSGLQQRRRGIGRRARSTEAVEFFNVLSSAELLETTEALLPEHRERLYPPSVALSMFMRQVLQADGSCQRAVNGWAAQRMADGLTACSVRTGGYCRARQRLPLEMVCNPHARNRASAQQKGAGAMAVALALGQAGGRHRDLDARHPGQPGVLSPAQYPGTWSGISSGPAGHGELPGQRR